MSRQRDKEHRWLPVLARSLPVPIPVSVGLGHPAQGYPYRWSIRPLARGQPAPPDGDRFDPVQLAVDVAAVYHRAAADRPGRRPAAAGAQLLSRCLAGALRRGDQAQHRRLLPASTRARANEVWQAGLAATGTVRRSGSTATSPAATCWCATGRLHAVIDFGTSGVGDPACDLVIAWTLFDRSQPPGVPPAARTGRRDLGPGPRLGAVEGTDRAGRRSR